MAPLVRVLKNTNLGNIEIMSRKTLKYLRLIIFLITSFFIANLMFNVNAFETKKQGELICALKGFGGETP